MQTIKHQPITTRVKARKINEDKMIYGTFAEIGAGLEVASAFFRAGGASGTVAKTMSAYDMTFSDTIYGREESGRYVIENRLHKMLDREFKLLLERIGEKMSDRRFFVFADTVATKSPKRGRPGHGWLGCAFQKELGGPIQKIVLHVHLFESLIESQQNLIGVLGVNLLYGAFYFSDDLTQLLESLMDGLVGRKFQVDVFKVEGSHFQDEDNRLLSIQLISLGLSNAILFNEQGKIESVSDRFYNQSVVVGRGSFRPPTKQTYDMLVKGQEQLGPLGEDDASLPICEISYNNLLKREDTCDHDFIFRLELLSAMRIPTLISNFAYHYRLSEYLSMFTSNQVVFAVGLDTLVELFKEEYYKELPGGILEAMGRLFKQRVKIFVYPSLDDKGKMQTSKNLHLPPHLKFLFESLACQQLIQDYKDIDPHVLAYHSHEILEKIRIGDPDWREGVLPEVAALIDRTGNQVQWKFDGSEISH